MSAPRQFGRRTFLTVLSDLGIAGLIGPTWRPSRPRSAGLAPESSARREPPPRLDRLTCADFARHLGEPFSVTPESGPPLALTLHEAKGLRAQPGPVPGLVGRPPFSVLFHGPDGSRLEQGTYRVRHHRLGPLDLLLVPIGPRTDDVACYEAIFG